MSHHPRSASGEYICPVAGCTAAIGGYRKILGKHLKDEKAHSITELLDCGIHAWHHRKSSPEKARELIGWLQGKGLINLKDPSTTHRELRKREEKQLKKEEAKK